MRSKFHKYFFLCGAGILLANPIFLLLFDIVGIYNAHDQSFSSFPTAEAPKDLLWISPKIDQYILDHLPLQNTMISLQYWFRREVFNEIVFPRVVIGKDDWLYYTDENIISIYQRVLPLTQEQLKAIQENIESEFDWLASIGIHMVVVIAPDKNTIYPEFLPDEIQILGEISQYDQLINFMRINSHVDILDLRPALLERKESLLIYYRYDTHWNLVGCHAAYEVVMLEIEREFPYLQSYPLQDFSMITENVSGDLMRFIGQADVLEPDPYFLVLKSPAQAVALEGSTKELSEYVVNNPDLPRLVMLGDSFGPCLIKFIAEHFSYSLFRWERIPADSLLDRELIKQVNPDLVIVELTERYIVPRLIPSAIP